MILNKSNYTSSDSVPWSGVKELARNIVFEDYIYPQSTAYWFADMESIGYINLTKLDTSNTTNMSHMFYNFRSYEGGNSIDLSNWNTSNVTNMSHMFAGSSVYIENLENWNTSNVTNMEGMFSGVWPDQYPDNGMNLSGWNVCKVTNYNYFGFDAWSEIDLNGKVLTEPYFNDSLRCNGGNPA